MGALTGAQREAIRTLEMEYLDLVRGVFRDGQKRGRLRKLDPTVAAFTLLGVLNSFDRWYDPAGPVAPNALVEHVETIFLDGVAEERRK